MMRRRSVRQRALAICLMLGVAVAGPAGHAVEPPPGSRNFTPPSSVPNYFSNEAAPFQGGAGARAAQPGADQFNAGTAPSSTAATSRRHVRKHSASAGRAKHRGKLARGKAKPRRQAVRARASRGGKAAIVRGAKKPAVSKAAIVRGAKKPAVSKAAPSRGRPTAKLASHASRGR